MCWDATLLSLNRLDGCQKYCRIFRQIALRAGGIFAETFTMRWFILTLTLFATQTARGYDVATFADTGLISGVNQYNNSSGGFTSGGQFFNNTYYSAYGGYWNGFSV